MLEVIYVVRHGFRANWSVDPNTGSYSSSIPTPTGIAADPALSSKGNQQARELGEHLFSVQPSIDMVVSSPYYRCLQTVRPFVELAAERGPQARVYSVRPDTGFAEWYGVAPFEHPTHAPIDTLSSLFPSLSLGDRFVTSVVPPRYGESVEALHDRVAAAADSLIRQADRDGARAVLVCVHAAVIIAMGRVLTGHMPDDPGEEDFGSFTCGLSTFRRNTFPMAEESRGARPDWKTKGVAGGWVCERNSDCSFLSGGEERGWRFSGDESFRELKQAIGTDAGLELGIVIEGRKRGNRSADSNL
ncbi:Transcription factor tau 55 kDa subunit [Zalerion maritima]|uniref:Transcription factor tau 55 kDa subunit n=1 Tax=Zalerion maritima TaxID=339359 RepID=A0AAD5RMK9_9PEZI|nr:Transcription factor tau 55 kDa subunit [Zalerion maritima]